MKIYFIYNFSMEKEAQAKIAELQSNGYEVFAFSVKKKVRRWKAIAKKKIFESDFVCWLFNGEIFLSHSKNTIWEYRKARKYGKRVIIIDANEGRNINDIINDENKPLFKKVFNENYDEKGLTLNVQSFDETKFVISKVKNWNTDQDVFGVEQQSTNLSNSDYYKLLLEQYKIMVNTSESLMNRRQTTSNVFVAILTALISLVGSSFALSNRIATGIIFFAVGVVTTILSFNWKKLLINYNKNNVGKFTVINAIERRLPANMFDSEYHYNKMKSIASYADRENALCNVFYAIGLFVSCGGLVIFVLGIAGII